MRPWQDWRWVAAVACVMFAISGCVTATYVVLTNEQVQDLTPILEGLDVIATDNRQTLVSLEENQAGIDSLVAFVEEYRAEDSSGRAGAVEELIDVLCASQDPIRIAACVELGVLDGDP